MEHQLVIPKVPVPKSKDDLRNLGLSPFFSKCLEWVLVGWLWPTISKFISNDQLGGMSGCGTNHYLARLINYIYTGLDSKQSGTSAVAAMCIDLSKAFNRLNHSKVMTVLFDMGTPICALRLLYSYLENRRMRLHMNGTVSSTHALPGGGPQGGLLIVLLFNINSN